jgi:hypothetical protein
MISHARHTEKSALLFDTFLPSDVELWYHTFDPHVLAPLTKCSIFFAATLDFTFAAAKTGCLLGAHGLFCPATSGWKCGQDAVVE